MVVLRRILIYFAFSAAGFCAAGAEIPVGGQVFVPGGPGLEGIRVGLEPVPPEFERVEARFEGDVGPGVVVEAATDADGFFELLAPGPGAWKVLAAWSDGAEDGGAPAYLAEEFLLLPLTEPTELPPLALQPASLVEVAVLDEDGTPADARLALSDGRRSQDGWRPRLRLARTGEDGVARLAFGAAEEPRLEVLGPSHPLLLVSVGDRAAKGGSVGLRLAPGGAAGTAVVTDRRGRPVAGAVAYQGSGGVPLGRTDEDGRLRLVAAPPEQGPSEVSFLTRDGLSGRFEPRFSPDGTHEADVVLEPIARIRGQVVDVSSRDPVAGALVWVPGGPMTEADVRGRYELRFSPPAWLIVQAVAAGYAMALERKEIEGAGSEDGPTIALAPAATVSGTVSDTEGRPLAGVDVSVKTEGNRPFPRNAAFLRGPLATRSTRAGRFYLTGLPPSASCELVFRKRGFAPARRQLEGLAAFEERAGVAVVLDPGRSGVGRVVDGTDAPVAGADVRLAPVASGDPRTAYRARLPGNAEDEPASALTDPEGRFRLSHLAAGRYELEVKAAGFAPFTVPGLTVDEGPDEQDFGTVVLTPGVRIEGVVRDPEGYPLAAAEVHLDAQDSGSTYPRSEPVATSDESGRFVVADLGEGRQYVLGISKPGYGSETANAVAEMGATVEVVLHPAGTISGRVRDEDGEPVEGAFVFAEPTLATTRYPPRSAATDDRGVFRLEGVDPGTVRLSVHARGYQGYQISDLEVSSGGETSGVEVVLLRGATVVGTVTLEDGTPAVNATVSWAPGRERASAYGGFQASGETDGEGRYRIDGLALGPSVIQATQGARRQVSKSVDVASGTQTVDLAFADGFDVSGRVSDAAGLPVAGAALELTATDAGRRGYSMPPAARVTSGADGTFNLEDVASGRYLLKATKEGYAQAATPGPVEVAGGPVTGIELELRRGATLSGRILGLEADDLAGVAVLAFGIARGGGAVLTGLVDFEGRYTVADLGPGSWNVLARLEGGRRQAAGRLTVEEGEIEAELDLEFETGFTLQGVVRSAGRPVSGIQVFANGVEMPLVHAQAVSDSDGRFLMTDLAAGKYRLTAFNDTSRHHQIIEVPTDGEVVVELGVLRISGHVRDEAGERPLPGAAVRIERLEPETADPFVAHSGRSQTVTDSRGYFSLSAGAGVCRLIATKAGYGAAETTIEGGAGGRHEGLELRMSLTDGISFDVLPESGVLPSQVLAAVLDPSGRVLSQGWVPVGEGGTVRLSTVPAGRWELAVQAGESGVVQTPVTAPGHVGQIQLPRGGTLRIRIAELAGAQPGPGRPQLAQVRLVGPDGRPHFLLAEETGQTRQWPLWNGRATIPRLVPGVWRFTVTLPDGRSWSGEAVVSPGETTETNLP